MTTVTLLRLAALIIFIVAAILAWPAKVAFLVCLGLAIWVASTITISAAP